MYRAIPCQCSAAKTGVCKSWHVDPVAAVQGVNFTKAQAHFVASVLNAADALRCEDVEDTAELVREASRDQYPPGAKERAKRRRK